MMYLLCSYIHCVVPGCLFVDRLCKTPGISGRGSSVFLCTSNSCFDHSQRVLGLTDVLSSCNSRRMSVWPRASSFAVEAKVLMVSRFTLRERWTSPSWSNSLCWNARSLSSMTLALRATMFSCFLVDLRTSAPKMSLNAVGKG